MKTCEYVLTELRPLSGKGKNRVWPKCGRPAFYLWTFGRPQMEPMLLCKEHGDGCAGNFMKELEAL